MSEISPLVKVARDLREIVALAGSLEDQAIAKATDRLMPGGLAMVALAGVANQEAYGNLIDGAERRAYALAEEYDLDPDDLMPELYSDDWEPPLQTLRFWSEAWRVEHGMDYDQQITLETEAKFLGWAAQWAWDNEPHFEDFARDVRAARLRMENLLYAGDRAERTRVTCDREHCERNPRLIKVYGPVRVVGYRCRECGHGGIVSPDATHCANPTCWSVVPPEPMVTSDPAEDHWKCASCKTRFDADEFKRAHAKQLRSESAEKFLPLPDAIGTLRAQGRGLRTIRRWLAPTLRHTADACTECGATWEPQEYAACPAEVDTDEGVEECGGLLVRVWSGDANAVIESYCELVTHRVYVWWPDLWRLHHATRTTPRVAS